MGYTTEFFGQLNFGPGVTVDQVGHLNNEFLGKDCREHDWPKSEGLTHVDLEITDDFQGIKHDGSEKTYNLEDIVNMIIYNMCCEFPNFSLSGEIEAQGEEPNDRWILRINKDTGYAERIECPGYGSSITCPNCKHEFKLEV